MYTPCHPLLELFFLKGAVSVCHGWSAVFNDLNSLFISLFLPLSLFLSSPVRQQLPSLAEFVLSWG